MTVPRNFKIHMKLRAFEKSGDEQPMRIGGVVSTDDLDQEDERIIQDGLDFSQFLDKGWFNDNHSKKSTGVLGYPTSASFVTKGSSLPDGTKAESNCWWSDGFLLNTEDGRKTWTLAQSLADTPRSLGFSIEGTVKARSPRNKNIVTRAIVRNVAITHCPVNTGTELLTLAKAMTAGHAIDSGDIGTGAGDGGALRSESLEDEEDDLVTDEEIDKAEGFEIEPISEYDYIESMSAVMASIDLDPRERLSVGEARVIVKSQMPHLNSGEIDEIINNARSLA